MNHGIETIKNLPDISFIEDLSLESLLQLITTNYEMRYEELTGKKQKLSSTLEYQILVYAFALQYYQALQLIDRTGKMNLLKYAYGTAADHMALLKGVRRNEATYATVSVKITRPFANKSALLIPVGTRVSSGNDVFFELLETTQIDPEETQIETTFTCTKAGEIGNGYLPGEITTLIDPLVYAVTVENTTESSGGSEIESDNSLIERAYLAPAAYTTTGTEAAYIFWAKTYHQDISDVKPNIPAAGEVNIRFLVRGELPEETMLTGLLNFLSSKEIRPLTDLVTVSAPDVVPYEIHITYWISETDKGQAITIKKQVEQAIESYQQWQNHTIGRDINPSKLVAMIMGTGVKRVEVTNPVYAKVDDLSIAYSTSVKLIEGGIEGD